MSLKADFNVTETITAIALHIRSINQSFAKRIARKKCLKRWGLFTIFFLFATPAMFCVFNAMYTNFNLLLMTRDDFN